MSDENPSSCEEEALNEVGFSETGKLKKKISGNFAAMGLMPALLKVIQRKGFRQPTPIQRKAIPALLEGRDVVGMARTGSGKTAAFLLPLLQHLRGHSARVGLRGLVLSPNRELALQTFAVAQALAKFTDLRIVSLIGGDGLEEQFARMATNPDLVIATPGRLLHLCVEAGLSLRTVQWVVWDEADRLMEDSTMASQMAEITGRLAEGGSRQTALFSATLPKALAEFAQAGLSSPHLIRLDAESKISPDLGMRFLALKSDYRDSGLLWLLDEIYGNQTSSSSSANCLPLTVIFAATKHHVEYLQELLGAFGKACVYIYGSLDQTARQGAIEAFRAGRKPILVVTDVAARGIDVPLLDNVINYDFPPTPKLFLHRVGRVARAGRPGMAYSLVSPDEVPYMLDVQMFLGKTLRMAGDASNDADEGIVFGSLLQSWLDDEQERLIAKHSINGTISSLKQVMLNATKLYRKTRPAASPESHRRAKEMASRYPEVALHPDYASRVSQAVLEQGSMISALRSFKPRQPHVVSAPSVKPKTTNIPDEKIKSFQDSELFLGYRPAKDLAFEEKAYSINFAREASAAMLDTASTVTEDPRMRGSKRSLSGGGKPSTVKMIKTDRGTKIPASYQKDIYARWKSKTKLAIPKAGDLESNETVTRAQQAIQAMGEKGRWRRRPKGKNAKKTRKPK